MSNNRVTFLPLDHPDATAVTDLLRRAREDQEYANAIISVAAHLLTQNALNKGVTCPEKATEYFKSVVGMSIMANRRTGGSA